MCPRDSRTTCFPAPPPCPTCAPRVSTRPGCSFAQRSCARPCATASRQDRARVPRGVGHACSHERANAVDSTASHRPGGPPSIPAAGCAAEGVGAPQKFWGEQCGARSRPGGRGPSRLRSAHGGGPGWGGCRGSLRVLTFRCWPTPRFFNLPWAGHRLRPKLFDLDLRHALAYGPYDGDRERGERECM